jgi:hypothetical protein
VLLRLHEDYANNLESILYQNVWLQNRFDTRHNLSSRVSQFVGFHFVQPRKTETSFRIFPKMIGVLTICRVCKTFNPKHRPRSCAAIRCGKCSQKHSTKIHPESSEILKRAVCGEANSFNGCPQRKSTSKKALKDAHKKEQKSVLAQEKQKQSREYPP